MNIKSDFLWAWTQNGRKYRSVAKERVCAEQNVCTALSQPGTCQRPATTPFLRPVMGPVRHPPLPSRDDLSVKWKPGAAERNSTGSPFFSRKTADINVGKQEEQIKGRPEAIVSSFQEPRERHCLAVPKASRWSESLLESAVR